jgi:pyruvyltransferase
MAPRIFETASGHRAAWVSRQFSGKLILQGSILAWALAPGDVVWGAGLIESTRIEVPEGVEFLAVRGPLTRRLLSGDVPDLYCDPGALAPLRYQRSPSRAHAIGIVPHYADRPYVGSTDPDVFVIDVLRPVQQVVSMITSCDVIISSSLHGIVIAEAFDIPTAWVTFGDRLKGGSFKFRDYYLGTERDPKPPVAWSGNLNSALAAVREPGIQRTNELLDALTRAKGFTFVP